MSIHCILAIARFTALIEGSRVSRECRWNLRYRRFLWGLCVLRQAYNFLSAVKSGTLIIRRRMKDARCTGGAGECEGKGDGSKGWIASIAANGGNTVLLLPGHYLSADGLVRVPLRVLSSDYIENNCGQAPHNSWYFSGNALSYSPLLPPILHFLLAAQLLQTVSAKCSLYLCSWKYVHTSCSRYTPIMKD